VGLGAFLGAFFLCRICFLRGFLSLIMAKRVFVLLCPHLFERLFVKLCRARSNDAHWNAMFCKINCALTKAMDRFFTRFCLDR
jgi:hypothetical protein